MIIKETIDRIMETALIEEVISDFVTLKKLVQITRDLVHLHKKKRLLLLFHLQNKSSNVLALVKEVM